MPCLYQRKSEERPCFKLKKFLYIDIEAETREFYKTFYEYELTDEDYASMMEKTNYRK